MSSKENASALVGGMGVASSLISSLVKEVRERGGKDEDIHRLVTPVGEATLNRIADLILNDGKPPIDPFKNEKRGEGWILLRDVGFNPPVEPANLGLVSFLKPGEVRGIYGWELVPRAEELHANLGQRHAEYFLEHQDRIPEEFRKYTLLFPGTIWRDLKGEKHIAMMRWSETYKWMFDINTLGWCEDSYERLVRPFVAP